MKRKVLMLLCTVLLLMCFVSVASAANDTVNVSLPSFRVTLNGQVVNNDYSEYPLIVYNDITYFPMTYNDCRFYYLDIYTSN